MNISYEHYKIFYYVAKYKNLTVAANELHLNQPNISRTIKLLEQETGCKLITRKSRGIELTPEGERLYFYTQNAVKQLELAEAEITAFSTLSTGSITVGVSETAAYMTLLPALKSFEKAYPNIRVTLHSHNSSSAIELVKQGLVDFSITTVFRQPDKSLTSTTILSYSDILVGGPSYKHLTNPLTLKDISRLPLIYLSPETSSYQFYQALFAKKNLPFEPLYMVETTGQLCPMLLYDLGVSFIPALYVQNSLSQGAVCEIPLAEPLPNRNICIIENPKRYTNLAAQKLKEFCMHPANYRTF